jgi:calcium/calmodulin-dependent protein kinase I
LIGQPIAAEGAWICIRPSMAASPAADQSEAPPSPLFGQTFTEVSAEYELGRKLGSGNFAKVLHGRLRAAKSHLKLKQGDSVAIKVVKKPSARRSIERVQMLKAEVEILRSIQHPNIVRLYEIHESPSRLYIVMELLTGGELFDRIVGLGKYSEEDARYFTFKLLNAVLYLHDRSICHRDLKPENILLASPDADAELKITDFGLSKIASSLPEDFLMTTRCGTPGYVAPEVLSQEVSNGELRRYGTSCDMWSVGVIVYILLSAAPPFYGKTDAEMNRRIKQGLYRFPDRYWAHISSAAKDLIGRLLTVDPTRRMSAAEALQHDWIVSIGTHTNDLFAFASMKGVPVMQVRFGEFNQERRGEARAFEAMRDLLALPEEEEELHHFRCSHQDRTGHLILTPSHLSFLAYDQSTMFSLPILAIESMQAARAMTWAAASDNSLILRMENGATTQFDGFWERDECMTLLQACGRFLNHPIDVDATDEAAASPAPQGAPSQPTATDGQQPQAPSQTPQQQHDAGSGSASNSGTGGAGSSKNADSPTAAGAAVAAALRARYAPTDGTSPAPALAEGLAAVDIADVQQARPRDAKARVVNDLD